jgi:hypothetical protein
MPPRQPIGSDPETRQTPAIDINADEFQLQSSYTRQADQGWPDCGDIGSRWASHQERPFPYHCIERFSRRLRPV